MFESPLVKAFVIDMSIQWMLGTIASYLQTEKFFDLTGGVTFLYLTWQVLSWARHYNNRQIIQSSCVTIWAARLAIFLVARVLREGQDSRFKKARNSPPLMMMFWTIQGVWIFATLLPTLILNNNRKNPSLNWKDYLGWSMWTLGFCIQVIADHQKTVFRSNPANFKKYITTGLWSIVRYPNYLGEIIMWFGLFLPASNVMQGWQHLSAISPLLVTFFLTKVSGIPLQEAQAARRWLNDKYFQDYLAKTSKLIPGIW